MEFQVKFVTNTGYAIKTNTPQGVSMVEFIRDTLGLPEFPVKRVNSPVEKETDPNIEITFQSAKASGHFAEKKFLEVKTKSGFLNQFLIKKVNTETTETGETLQGWVSWDIDQDAIIDAWAKAGYPLSWGIE